MEEEISVTRFEVLLAKYYAARSKAAALNILEKLHYCNQHAPITMSEESFSPLARRMYQKLRQRQNSLDIPVEDAYLATYKAYRLLELLGEEDLEIARKEVDRLLSTEKKDESDSLASVAKTAALAGLASSLVAIVIASKKTIDSNVAEQVAK